MTSNNNTQKAHLQFLAKIQKSPFKNQILKAYGRLNVQITELNDKISNVIEKQQGQFVIAYNNHITNLRKQLEIIKTKAQQTEKQLRSNDWVVFFQKQMTIFRQQSLKMYEKLQQKSQEAEIYKLKFKDVQKTVSILQKQVKQNIKSRKLLEIQLNNASAKIQQLQAEIIKKQERIRELNNSVQTKTELIPKMIQGNTNLSFKVRDSTKLSNRSKNLSIISRNKSMSHSSQNNDYQLKEWFFQCVKAVRKQIANRKINGMQLNFNAIHNIKEFRTIDKLRLLEKFIQNEKLIVWMYEKIFPSRQTQINEYLSHRKTCVTEPTQFDIETNQSKLKQQIFEDIKLPINSTRIQVNLPKQGALPTPIKNRKNKDRVSVTEGKLYILNPLHKS